MTPVDPFRVAVFVFAAFPKNVLQKFASGSTPPDYGASTIHSADERLACETFAPMLNDFVVVRFLSEAMNCRLFGSYFTSAVTTSPACTGTVLMMYAQCG